MDNKEQLVDELSKAIFLNCHVGLFEDEAKMIAKFAVEEIERRNITNTKIIFSNLRDLWNETRGHIPYHKLVDFERRHGG